MRRASLATSDYLFPTYITIHHCAICHTPCAVDTGTTLLIKQLTSEEFLALIKNQIYQLVVPTEGALELPPADALDPDGGVLEAGKLEDALLLGPPAASAAPASSTTPAAASAASTTHDSLRSVGPVLRSVPFVYRPSSLVSCSIIIAI